MRNKCFVDHIVEHIETLEPSTRNFGLYIEILKDFDLFLKWKSDYIFELRHSNYKSIYTKFRNYITEANNLTDEKQKHDRISMYKQILWKDNTFEIKWDVENFDYYYLCMVAWTKCCIKFNLDKNLANIDYQTYQELLSRDSIKWGEPSFHDYSSNYLSKVARLLLDQ